jgi:hypothetical protein
MIITPEGPVNWTERAEVSYNWPVAKDIRVKEFENRLSELRGYL